MVARQRKAKAMKNLLVVLILFALCNGVQVFGVGEDFTPEGSPYDVDYVIPNTDPYGLCVLENVTVNLLPGAHVQGGYYHGDVAAYGILNIYGGLVDGDIQIVETSITTIYGSNFVIDDGSGPVNIDPGATVIENPNASVWDSYEFTLSGLNPNGEPISYHIILTGIYNLNSYLYLNQPQPEPDIQVYPTSLEIDFGNIEVGSSSSYVVQIYNFGNADLTITDLTITGSSAFQITSAPSTPFVMAPSDTIVVDVVIKYTPTEEGYVTGSLVITSDDPDESSVDIFLGGAGVINEIPPIQQIQNIIAFFDQSVADGTILGYGPGNLPAHRVKALRCMLEASGHLIQEGYNKLALLTLVAVDKVSDGKRCPQDFIVGENVAPFNLMVNDLIEDLQ